MSREKIAEIKRKNSSTNLEKENFLEKKESLEEKFLNNSEQNNNLNNPNNNNKEDNDKDNEKNIKKEVRKEVKENNKDNNDELDLTENEENKNELINNNPKTIITN